MVNNLAGRAYLGWFRSLDRATRSRATLPPMLKLTLDIEGRRHHHLTLKELGNGHIDHCLPMAHHFADTTEVYFRQKAVLELTRKLFWVGDAYQIFFVKISQKSKFSMGCAAHVKPKKY